MTITPLFAQRGACGKNRKDAQTTHIGSADVIAGPLTDPPVLGVPLSAMATTTVRQTLKDGSRVERTGIARYYRDRMGRVRVEQTFRGNQALNSADGGVRITIQSDPSQRAVFTLDPATRTANRHPAALAQSAVGGGDTFALPLGGPRWRFLVFSRGEHLRGVGAAGREDSLGFRRIDGIAAIGRRVTMTIPVGVFGNDQPFQHRRRALGITKPDVTDARQQFRSTHRRDRVSTDERPPRRAAIRSVRGAARVYDCIDGG